MYNLLNSDTMSESQFVCGSARSVICFKCNRPGVTMSSGLLLTLNAASTIYKMLYISIAFISLPLIGIGCIEGLGIEDAFAALRFSRRPSKTHVGEFGRKYTSTHISDSIPFAFTSSEVSEFQPLSSEEELERGQPASVSADAAEDEGDILPCVMEYLPPGRQGLPEIGSSYGGLSPTELNVFSPKASRRHSGACHLDMDLGGRRNPKFWSGERSTKAADTLLSMPLLREAIGKPSRIQQISASAAIEHLFPLDRPRQMYTSRGTLVNLQRIADRGNLDNDNSAFFQDVGKSGAEQGGIFLLNFFPIPRGMIKKDERRMIQSKINILKLLPEDLSPTHLFYSRRLILPLEIVKLSRSRWAISRRARRISDVALVMPSIKTNLQHVMNSIKYLQVADDLRSAVAIQMIQLVAGLHDFGIVHGALSHKSFLMSKRGILYLSDFDNSRRVSELQMCARTSLRNISPELARCINDLSGSSYEHESKCFVEASFASDSWALGMLLHSLWCQQDPFGRPVLERIKKELDVFGGTTVIPSNKTGGTIRFEECKFNVPLEMRNIIRGFLHPYVELRVRPSCALSALGTVE